MLPEDRCSGLVPSGLVPSDPSQSHDDGKSQFMTTFQIMMLVASLFFVLGWWACQRWNSRLTNIVSTQSPVRYLWDHEKPRFHVLPAMDHGAWHQ